MFRRLATALGLVLVVSSFAVAGQSAPPAGSTPESKQPAAGKPNGQPSGGHARKNRKHRRHRRTGRKGTTPPNTPTTTPPTTNNR